MSKPLSKSKNSVPSDKPRRQPLIDQNSQRHQLSQTIILLEITRKPVLFSKVPLSSQSPPKNLSLKALQRQSNEKLLLTNNKQEMPLIINKQKHINSLQNDNIEITPQKNSSYNNENYRLSPYVQVSRSATPETPFYTQSPNEVQPEDSPKKRFHKEDPYVTIGRDSQMKKGDDYYALISQNSFLKTGEMTKQEISYQKKTIKPHNSDQEILQISKENEQLKEANKEFFEENRALYEQIEELQSQQSMMMNELSDLRKQSQRMEKINEAYINSVDQAFEVENTYKLKLEQKEMELDDKEKIIKNLRSQQLDQRGQYDKSTQELKRILLTNEQGRNRKSNKIRRKQEYPKFLRYKFKVQFNKANQDLLDQVSQEKQLRLRAEKELKEINEKVENYQREFQEKQKAIFELKQDNEEKARKLQTQKQDVDCQMEKFKVDLQFDSSQHQNEINMKNNTIEQLMRTIQKLQRERLQEYQQQQPTIQQEECLSAKSSLTLEQVRSLQELENYAKQLESIIESQRQELEEKKNQEQKYLLSQAQIDQLEMEKNVWEQKLVELQTQINIQNKQSSFGSSNKETSKLKQIIAIQKQQIESQQKTILNQHYEVQNLQNLIYSSNEVDYSKTITSQCDQESDKQSTTSKQNKRTNWETTQKGSVLNNISNKYNDLQIQSTSLDLNFTMKPLVKNQLNEDTFRNMENE